MRLGHPARVLPALREHTLDLLVEDHPDARQARKLAKEAFALFRQAGKWTRAKPRARRATADMRQEARALLADARKLEAQAVERILDARAGRCCATTTGLDAELLGDRRFDLLVIDEACQTTEPGCWIAAACADRVVLAGDHCQLPPTVLSPRGRARRASASACWSASSALYGDARHAPARRAVPHARARSWRFSSREFYDGTLVAARERARRTCCATCRASTRTPLTEAPVTFIDTAGAGYDEEQEPDGESRLNPQEAALAARKVRRAARGRACAGSDIAVIAPYAAQVRLLRELLADVAGLEIDSVDGFQGREKEAVVLSLVRSNAEGEIGFLADVRRTNVALTRARRGLVVIGDSATLAAQPFYQRLCRVLRGDRGVSHRLGGARGVRPYPVHRPAGGLRGPKAQARPSEAALEEKASLALWAPKAARELHTAEGVAT